MKDDTKTFRAVCTQLGMTAEERIGFGEYIHDLKGEGIFGTANERGDFTWHELVDHGNEYLKSVRE